MITAHRRHLFCFASVKFELYLKKVRHTARMVTKRIRSEYMKKFKDPKWETYSKCYEEMLKYRLARRLLEHSHNPWFWSGWDSGSESSDSPSPLNKNKVEPLVVKDESPPRCGRRTPEHRETPPRAPAEQPVPATEEEPRAEDAALESAPSTGGQASVTREAGEAEDEKTSGAPNAPNDPEQGEEEPAAQPKPSRKPPKLRGPLRRSRESSKDNRHPFALYGWGEQQAEMASRKTHNVCPAASTNEIHESALRAKTQREVERQMQTQRADRRRAQSADLDQTTKTKAAPDFDPWVTEYMRCFSARSRYTDRQTQDPTKNH